jgi:hypothetical protein
VTRALIPRAAVAALCGAALAGCGGGGGGDQSASDAVQNYVDARNQRDFGAVCEGLSEGLRQRLGGSNCERFMEEQTSGLPHRDLKVISVSESGNSATARLQTTGETGKPTQLQVSLERQDNDWRITRLGGAGFD